MSRHHHHSSAPAVAAALVGAAAAALAGYLVHKENTGAISSLHEEMHQVGERSDARTAMLNEVMGRNFAGVAAGQQNLADAINNNTESLAELKHDLFRPRAQPGGEEPPA